MTTPEDKVQEKNKHHRLFEKQWLQTKWRLIYPDYEIFQPPERPDDDTGI